MTRRLAQQISAMNATSSARGTSLSITMHELRRPLTILNSYGQLLSTGMLGQMPDTASVAIDGITASTEMMVRMVNALAELSRLEDPDDKLTYEADRTRRADQRRRRDGGHGGEASRLQGDPGCLLGDSPSGATAAA